MTARDTRPDENESADLIEAAREVARTGKRRVIRAGGKALAVLSPCEPSSPPRSRPGSSAQAHPARRRDRPFTMEDPLWEIVGIATHPGPGDVASNKHKYLAEDDTADTE